MDAEASGFRIHNGPNLGSWAAEDGMTRLVARPASGENGAPWVVAAPGARRALDRVLGTSAYRAHAGAYSGGANGVYWISVETSQEGAAPGVVRIANRAERGRRRVEPVRAEIEADLVYPLLLARDIVRRRAVPSGRLLLPQDPRTRKGIDADTMTARYPRALAYLARFEDLLRERAAYRRYFRPVDPWWSVFDVGDYTFAPWKVVWRQIAGDLAAAVVGPVDGKPVVPQHTVALVGLPTEEEAHYLAGLLNAGPAAAAIRSFSSAGTKGFAAPHALARLRVPGFDPGDALHRRIAALSRAFHEAAASPGSEPAASEDRELRDAASALWGLDAADRRALGLD
jgi:hypothetical protein